MLTLTFVLTVEISYNLENGGDDSFKPKYANVALIKYIWENVVGGKKK